MPNTALFSLKWQSSRIRIFILLITLRLILSDPPPEMACSLQLPLPAPGDNSSCIEGDWGGFLRRNCCGSAFYGYLYALGVRANQTGLIYLNSGEQMSCLAAIQGADGDVFSCGIERLTRGGGGCSDFSVADVGKRLGDQVKSLREHCTLVGTGEALNQSCGSCIKSWQDTRATHAVLPSAEHLKTDNDICRFAVLVSFTSSRVHDEDYVKRVFKCLGEQRISTGPEENQVADGKRKFNISTGIMVGIGSGIAVIIIVVIVMFVYRKYYKSNKKPSKNNAFKEMQLKDSPCRRFAIKEVYSATKNLSEKNLIGEGTAGKVYKGVLSNNQNVAIKHIINDVNVETVVREVTSLSRIRHPNLVALLGYSVRKDDCFLIYELCPNGNLSQWIFGKDKILSWIQRLEIAVDSARGLWFLHTYSEGCIVHRDIKPTNILLGPNFEAKLSDFGLSKVIDLGETYVSSEVRGTFGYVDPEYQSNRQVNSSGDVYSFGIVLLQILSGKKVINMNQRKPMPLDKMAKSLTRGRSNTEFADQKLEGEYSAEAFGLTFRLALSCTALKQERPTMEQVVVRLEEALDISTRAKASSPEATTLAV